MLAHPATLAEARSYVAALADLARTFGASVEYERVLLRIDAIHGDDVPALTEIFSDRRDVLYAVAEGAIEELIGHGVDALQVELVLTMLVTARQLDEA